MARIAKRMVHWAIIAIAAAAVGNVTLTVLANIGVDPVFLSP